jgi:hypothetical protein
MRPVAKIYSTTLERVFGDELTAEILDLARERLLDGRNLAPRGCDRRKAKLALLLVREINPLETLYQDEAALIYGLHCDTVAKRQTARELVLRANVGK